MSFQNRDQNDHDRRLTEQENRVDNPGISECNGACTQTEVEKVKKESRDFIKFIVEYIQRKRGRELERTKIRVKHGNKYGEVILLDDTAFIIHDLDEEEK